MTLFISIDFGQPGAVDTQGTRPYTGTVPLWDNSSIFLDGGLSQTQTKEGLETTVKVRVSAAPRTNFQFVTVDAYVLAPFAGPLTPATALRTLTGFAGQITAGSGNPADPNDPHIVTCKIQDPMQGPIPWTPTQADLDATTNGHLCVIANAYAEEPASGGVLAGTTPFNVHTDPHQGQRNINVLQSDDMRKFKFQVFGPPEGAEFALDVRQLTARDFGASERWLLVSLPNVKAIPKGGERLFLTGGKGEKPRRLSHSRRRLAGSLDLGPLGGYDLGELAEGCREGGEGSSPPSSRRASQPPSRLTATTSRARCWASTPWCATSAPAPTWAGSACSRCRRRPWTRRSTATCRSPCGCTAIPTTPRWRRCARRSAVRWVTVSPRPSACWPHRWANGTCRAGRVPEPRATSWPSGTTRSGTYPRATRRRRTRRRGGISRSRSPDRRRDWASGFCAAPTCEPRPASSSTGWSR